MPNWCQKRHRTNVLKISSTQDLDLTPPPKQAKTKDKEKNSKIGTKKKKDKKGNEKYKETDRFLCNFL